MSADGLLLLVGASRYNENNGNDDAGAVIFFYRRVSVGETWTLQDRLDLYQPGNNKVAYPYSLALSGDNSRVVIGCPRYVASTFGINGDSADPSQSLPAQTGMVFVAEFDHVLENWSVHSTINIEGTSFPSSPFTYFGESVDISQDGLTIAVGAPGFKSLNSHRWHQP